MDLAMCVECEDTRAMIRCASCTDIYCELCFQAQHRKGTRKQHEQENIHQIPPPAATLLPPSEQPVVSRIRDTDSTTTIPAAEPLVPSCDFSQHDAKYIPLRLSEEERDNFILLDAGLRVSEYTDNVDVFSHRSSTSRRVLKELKEMFSLMSGLVIANNFHKGKKLIQGRDFMKNADFLQRVFEIGRRYKIMNPEKMRDNYGKMIYLLQDSSNKDIQRVLKFTCMSPIQTVFTFLEAKNALDILSDPLFPTATAAIVVSSGDLTGKIARKTQAVDELSAKYTSELLAVEDIQHCLASVSDSNSYMAQNCGPILKMIGFLEKHFKDQAVEPQFSLAISSGRNGARLSHPHKTQYYYVLQSLHLWNRITENMLALWFSAEGDMLSGTSDYRLRDTGQGLNRVQRAPRTSKMIHRILSEAQDITGHSWIGSSVVHLGDKNVCNALSFIDKYCCVSRILNPIVKTVEEIDKLSSDPEIGAYINDTFGSPEALQKQLLCDFFKHGFDGSGADNFFDAGSCIDGRLTSAWNWCSKIEKKSFYHIFLLAGFVGFDGSFG